MSALIFASPLAVIAMVCLWLGWMGRIWLFVPWAVFWMAVTVLIAVYVVGGRSPAQVIMILGGGVLLFQISIFGAGFLAKRARDFKAVDHDAS